MSSELLDIGDPLLPRLREAAMRNDEAHRWLLESARRWARGEFVRREERREAASGSDHQERLRWGIAGDGLGTDRLYVEERLHSLTYKQVAALVEYQPISGARQIERIRVGLLLPDSTDEYLKMMVSRTDTFAGLLAVYDIIELAPPFRTRKWPTEGDLPPTTRLEAERKRKLAAEQAQHVDLGQWRTMQDMPPLRAVGDSLTITETITFS